jgi:hypothetical protein
MFIHSFNLIERATFDNLSFASSTGEQIGVELDYLVWGGGYSWNEIYVIFEGRENRSGCSASTESSATVKAAIFHFMGDELKLLEQGRTKMPKECDLGRFRVLSVVTGTVMGECNDHDWRCDQHAAVIDWGRYYRRATPHSSSSGRYCRSR